MLLLSLSPLPYESHGVYEPKKSAFMHHFDSYASHLMSSSVSIPSRSLATSILLPKFIYLIFLVFHSGLLLSQLLWHTSHGFPLLCVLFRYSGILIVMDSDFYFLWR